VTITTGWVSTQSAAITTHGQPVLITTTQLYYLLQSVDTTALKIFRGATEIYFSDSFSTVGYAPLTFSFVDQPAAGTYTYSIQVQVSAPAGREVRVKKRALSLLEVQK
jgi:hypothetical protein